MTQTTKYVLSEIATSSDTFFFNATRQGSIVALFMLSNSISQKPLYSFYEFKDGNYTFLRIAEK